jgi:transcription-repair coupling factor (superfamily II helicase)
MTRFMSRSAKGGVIRAWNIGCRCFTTKWQTVFDYLERFPGVWGPYAHAEAAGERRAQIIDHYEARQTAQSIEKGKGVSRRRPTKPSQPDLLYLDTSGTAQASLDASAMRSG